jgi:hypothetical protein
MNKKLSKLDYFIAGMYAGRNVDWAYIHKIVIERQMSNHMDRVYKKIIKKK